MNGLQIFLAVCAAALLAPLVLAAELPDDSGRYHLVVVTGGNVADASLLQSLATHPQLSEVSKACKRFTFAAADPLYRARYATALGNDPLPIIALVRSDGGVLYKASGVNIPAPDELAQNLLKTGRADRTANPRKINAAPAPTLAGGPMDALRWPNLTPERLIPDTVTIKPEVTIAPEFGYAVFGVLGVLVLCFAGGGLLLFLGLIVLSTTRD